MCLLVGCPCTCFVTLIHILDEEYWHINHSYVEWIHHTHLSSINSSSTSWLKLVLDMKTIMCLYCTINCLYCTINCLYCTINCLYCTINPDLFYRSEFSGSVICELFGIHRTFSKLTALLQNKEEVTLHNNTDKIKRTNCYEHKRTANWRLV
jgi:hypothetical protein